MLGSTKAKKTEFDTLNELQIALRTSLTSLDRKFLLVLDDAWDDKNRDRWENLLAPLKFATKGGRILLTTRSETVARMAEQALMGVLGAEKSVMNIMTLGGINEGEYLKLFSWHAFLGKDIVCYPLLKSIGEQIAHKLGGSPLLAKVVGAMLNEKLNDTDYWRSVLDRSIPKDVMSNLRLSYHYLSPNLRPCFAYAGVLRQKNGFSKEDAIFMWMANGLIQEDSSRETMEMRGGRYFDELLKRSIFEPNGHYNTRGQQCHDMHDLLYELALSVSEGECFRFTDSDQVEDIPKTVRHLHFETSNLEIILRTKTMWKKLRTLVFRVSDRFYERENIKICKEAIESVVSIRVLVVDSIYMEILPDTVGCLRHLRYLCTNQISQHLPRLLSKLYNLQTVDLDGYKIQLTAKDLIRLRHIMPVKTLVDLPWIGKLTALQELVFHVKQEIGLRIEELKGLGQLRELSVKCIENVRNPEEAREARIHEKKHMRALSLSWYSKVVADQKLELCRNVDLERLKQVLEDLKPNSGLEKLTIKNYMGLKPPSWMDPRSLNDIQHIKLKSCSKWVQLCQLGKLGCLTHLYLSDMPGLKKIGLQNGFQQLQVLQIIHLEQWEEWHDESDLEAGRWCPHLCLLVIKDCPKLVQLPSLPLSLSELQLENVNLMALPTLQQPSSSVNCSSSSSSFPSSASISKICIRRILKLKSLAVGLLKEDIHALEHLEIEDCEVLSCLPWHLSSLKYLSLEGLPVMKQIHLEGSFPQLEIIKLCNLVQLKELCRIGSRVINPSLKELEILDCPMLNALPSIPLCLEKLSLKSVGFTALPQFWLDSSDGESCNSSLSSSMSSALLSYMKIEACPRLDHLASGLLQQQHHLRDLRELEITDCEELMYLPEGGFRHLCSLWRLQVRNCPKLQLPQLHAKTNPSPSSSSDARNLIPSSLQFLNISNCGEMERSLSVFLNGADSLSRLDLWYCNNMTCLPPADVMATLTSLQTLRIWVCDQLASLGGLNALHSLDDLEISKCPKLVGQPLTAAEVGADLPLNSDDNEEGEQSTSTFAVCKLRVDESLVLLIEPLIRLTSVELLAIDDCSGTQSLDKLEAWILQNDTSLKNLELHKVASLPTCIHSLYSLKTLWLYGADQVQSLPLLPRSLKELKIWGCNSILRKRLQKMRGADWPHIQHIPYIELDYVRIS